MMTEIAALRLTASEDAHKYNSVQADLQKVLREYGSLERQPDVLPQQQQQQQQQNQGTLQQSQGQYIMQLFPKMSS